MNFGDTTIFQLGKAKMKYLGQRQAVLALNVANVDTPGYRARDVKTPDFKSMVSGVGSASSAKMARTHTGHMQPMNNQGSFPIINRRELDEYNPNGNGVNIDTELQKVAFNQAEYDKVVSIYRKNISLIRIAIGNPNSG